MTSVASFKMRERSHWLFHHTRLRESVAQMEATGGTVYEVDFDD